MKLKFTLNDTQHEIDATRTGGTIVIEYDEQRHVLKVVSNDEKGMVVLQNGRFLRLIGQKEGDRRQLWVNGRLLSYSRVNEATAADSTSDNGSLSATIPAVVSEILVNVGDTVEAGDKLILLESMKMIIPIQAPSSGTVTAVYCAAGDSVQPGVPLVSME
ncbi:MAG: biotin/lipoyl-containing protein [Chloroflexota bacterium]